MRINLVKTLARYKILKSRGDLKTLLANYTQAQIKDLEQITDEILALCSEMIDIEVLKKLLIDKCKSANLNVLPKDLEAIYTLLAKEAVKKVAQNLGKKIDFTFDAVDAQAIDAMRKGFYWMGKEYNKSLQDRLKDSIEKVFTGEIAFDEIAPRLKDEFGSIINADERYFQGVSDHISLQAGNVATITQGAKHGVKYYKVLAVMDARTTQICRSMHGRIIEAAHLEAQASNILNAANLADKKAAAVWRTQPYLGKSDKMSSDFGLPPYHFRCRTEVVPVWIDEEEVGGVKMRNTSPISNDETIRHIDKIGVERVLKASNAHIFKKHKDVSKSDIIKGLNSIVEISPKRGEKNKLIAKTQNGLFMVLDGENIVSAYRPRDKQNKDNLKNYFNNNAEVGKKEIFKWQRDNFTYIFTKTLTGR